MTIRSSKAKKEKYVIINRVFDFCWATVLWMGSCVKWIALLFNRIGKISQTGDSIDM